MDNEKYEDIKFVKFPKCKTPEKMEAMTNSTDSWTLLQSDDKDDLPTEITPQIRSPIPEKVEHLENKVKRKKTIKEMITQSSKGRFYSDGVKDVEYRIISEDNPDDDISIISDCNSDSEPFHSDEDFENNAVPNPQLIPIEYRLSNLEETQPYVLNEGKAVYSCKHYKHAGNVCHLQYINSRREAKEAAREWKWIKWNDWNDMTKNVLVVVLLSMLFIFFMAKQNSDSIDTTEGIVEENQPQDEVDQVQLKLDELQKQINTMRSEIEHISHLTNYLYLRHDDTPNGVGNDEESQKRPPYYNNFGKRPTDHFETYQSLEQNLQNLFEPELDADTKTKPLDSTDTIKNKLEQDFQNLNKPKLETNSQHHASNKGDDNKDTTDDIVFLAKKKTTTTKETVTNGEWQEKMMRERELVRRLKAENWFIERANSREQMRYHF